jgi:hypothetical protein
VGIRQPLAYHVDLPQRAFELQRLREGEFWLAQVMRLLDECHNLVISDNGFAGWRILEPHLAEDAFYLVTIR